MFPKAMENSETINLDESNFDRELTQDDKPMIVDFWAEWCGPCKMIGPVLDELAEEYAGKVKIGKVNIDEQQALAAEYSIRAVPTLLLFNQGQVADQIVGLRSKRDLKASFERLSPPKAN